MSQYRKFEYEKPEVIYDKETGDISFKEKEAKKEKKMVDLKELKWEVDGIKKELKLTDE